MLLANAGLLLRSFVRLSSEQPGFDPTNVCTVRFSLPQVGYGDRAAIIQFYEKLQSRAESIAGIKSSALVSILPRDRWARAVARLSRDKLPTGLFLALPRPWPPDARA